MTAPYTAPEPAATIEDYVTLARVVLDEQTVRAADRTNMMELARGVLFLAGQRPNPDDVHPVYGECGCGAAMDEHGCPHGH